MFPKMTPCICHQKSASKSGKSFIFQVTKPALDYFSAGFSSSIALYHIDPAYGLITQVQTPIQYERALQVSFR